MTDHEMIRKLLWQRVVAALCDDICAGLRGAIQSADYAVEEFDRRFPAVTAKQESEIINSNHKERPS